MTRVVLDLDLAAHIGVDKLITDLRCSGFYDIADQIKLQTKPPEPTGLGAVIKDAAGYVYVRGYEPTDAITHPWHVIDLSANRPMGWWQYDAIDVVRVLSEGVPA